MIGLSSDVPDIDRKRNKLTKANVFFSVLYQVVVIICGLILPRAILRQFGSDINGVVSSITQFISCVALLRSGIGGVTRAALYKPLAEGNEEQVSRTMRATAIFMRKLAVIYCVLLLLLALLYPFAVADNFKWKFVSSLVLILGISTLFDCCFGVAYQFLLQADQHRYVQSIIYIFTTVLNTVVALIMINHGSTIHQVKFVSAMVFSLNPLFIYAYVRLNYRLDKNAEPDNTTIRERWGAFSHQVSSFITMNTDAMILTVFSDIVTVSIYSVYNQVAAPMRNLVTSVSNGIEASLGDILHRDDKSKTENSFYSFNYLMLQISTFMWTCTAILISPFVAVYSSVVSDANYWQPIFGYLLIIAQFLICIRIPYQTIVNVSGRFRETQGSAIIEAVINLSLSILAVCKFGLIGITVGTIVAVAYRTFYYAIYIERNFGIATLSELLKNIFCSLLFASVVFAICNQLPKLWEGGFAHWFLYSCIVAAICAAVMVIQNLIFYRRYFAPFLCRVKNVFRANKDKQG